MIFERHRYAGSYLSQKISIHCAARRFLRECANRPATLCRFFADVHMELVFAKLAEWKRISSTLQPLRMAVVEAVEARDGERAAAMVREYHTRAIELITSTPRASELKISDPGFSELIASVLNTRLATQVQ